jgi:hypothetical protein
VRQEETAGLMKIRQPPPAIFSNRVVREPQPIPPLMGFTLLPSAFYKHALIICHGDAEQYVRVRVIMDVMTTIYVRGDQYVVLPIVNTLVEIRGENLDPFFDKTTPTIEILSLDWS